MTTTHHERDERDDQGHAQGRSLPTFDELRADAYRCLEQAGDLLLSEWRIGTGPTTPDVGDHTDIARDAIRLAKKALTYAADAQAAARDPQ